jgi:hypothetical protein
MDEKNIPGLLSSLVSGAADEKGQQSKDEAVQQDSLLIQSLRALAGQSSDAAAAEVDEFLSGKGALHETTRAAMVRGKSAAVDDLSKVLVDQLKLSPTIASVIAGLLVQVIPSIGKESPTKKKPGKKTNPRQPLAPRRNQRRRRPASPRQPRLNRQPKRRPLRKPRRRSQPPRRSLRRRKSPKARSGR